MNRHFPDWITAYLEYSKFSEAPTKFHFWTAVSVIAGALQRKAWIDQRYFQWLPNFYIVFVSPPGIVSKSTTAAIGMDLLKEIPSIKFGPAALTWPSLVQALAQSSEGIELPGMDGEVLVQSAITIVASELGSLLDLKDRQMVDVMVDLWDGKKGAWEKWTKTAGNDKIQNPFVNIIGCTTPAWIQENFTKYLLGGGFTSRTVFVYAQEKRHLMAYPGRQFDKKHEEMRPKLLQDLEIITKVIGEYQLNEEAYTWGEAWYKAQYARAQLVDPTDQGLNAFLARKQTFLHKLAMVLSASRRNETTITVEEMKMADAMVTAIEGELAFVFGRIAERDEVKDVIEVLTAIGKAKSVSKTWLFRRLFTRMSAEQFEQALRSLLVAERITLIASGADIHIKVLQDGSQSPDPVSSSN